MTGPDDPIAEPRHRRHRAEAADADAVTTAIPVVAPGRPTRRPARDVAAVTREARRDPETQLIVPGSGRGARRRRRAAGPPARVRSQLDTRSVLTAAAVGTVLVVAAVLASVFGGPPQPAPVPPRPTASLAPAPADPGSAKAVAYLSALRAAGVPTSDSGQAETEAAAVLCQQLAKGAEEADLVRALPAVLPTVTGEQAATLVRVARQDYC